MRLLPKSKRLNIFITLFIILKGSAERATDDFIRYQPTWDSLDARPLPEWYDRDKIGVFIHWGVFSVPAQGEWFWYNWKGAKAPRAIHYMESNYKPNFTYQDFARDFTAEFFNATEWVTLFKKSGAKYVVITTKHHEGYTLWPSKYAFSWNSVDTGPHRNLVGELAQAIRNFTNLRFGVYHSLYEWFNPLYLDDKKHNFTKSHFVEFKTGPELYELVDEFKPEVIWSDGEWEASDDYWKAKKFLAWLYNDSPVRKTVVANDRWGSNTLCKHGGFLTCADRYDPGQLVNRKWENAMTIDKYSWGYRSNANVDEYLTTYELIATLIKTIAFGGNLLMNVGPTSAGKIPPIYQERLLDVGKWLRINGDAIYESNPWPVCQNDSQNQNIWYTSKNYNTKNEIIYALFLEWPTTGIISIQCNLSLHSSAKIILLGTTSELKWQSSSNSTEVILPNKADVSFEWAWTLKIDKRTTV